MKPEQNANTKPSRFPLTVSNLITRGLGYCCPWYFFQLFRQTRLIADRLGVTPRAIRYAKEKADISVCPCNPGCRKVYLRQDRSRLPSP